jgi:hypothetical protein
VAGEFILISVRAIGYFWLFWLFLVILVILVIFVILVIVCAWAIGLTGECFVHR